MLSETLFQRFKQHLGLSGDEKVAFGRIKNAAKDLGIELRLATCDDLRGLTDEQAERILGQLESKRMSVLRTAIDSVADKYPRD